MPTLLESCQDHFETKDLYAVLGIPKSSTESEVKRAYHKGSLRYHPDRVAEGEKDEATKKFQTLGKVYTLLSDKEKRAVYDESGEVDEDDEPQDRDWDEYWRLLFPKITLDDVKKFEEKYKGSEEELEDLKSAYTQYSGDMDKIMESVLCCTYEDEERFQEILKNLIKIGELPSHPKFSRETKAKKENRKKRMQKEAAEAEEMRSELGLGDGEDSLTKAIQKRQETRQKQSDNFLDNLAEKYGKKGPKKGKAAPASKKEKKLSSDEMEESEETVAAAKPSHSKNGKNESSEGEISEEEKPVAKGRGKKPAAEKKSAAESAKESKPARGKRGAAAAEPKDSEATRQPRSRRAATKEPKYTDDNSDEEVEKVAKPKGRKAAAKAVDTDGSDAETEKPVAKPKRGPAAKKSAKASDSQDVDTVKASKPARGKKGAAKAANESGEEEEGDSGAKGDGEQVESNHSDDNMPSNGFGDGHKEADDPKPTKAKRTTTQKPAKIAEKIDPPATKKSKVEPKSKKSKK